MRIFIFSVALVWMAAAQPPPPAQPIAFSHKTHAGTAKIRCNMCHPNKDPGEAMGIAPASTCMQCHTAVKPDHPEIQKVAEAAKANKAIRWARVYSIPGYVFFSHRLHSETGNSCADCHGAVAEREQLFREGNITMGGCMACHQKKSASNECTTCHEQRPQ